MKTNCLNAILFLFLCFLVSSLQAQNKPGKIIRSAPAGIARTTLDPNNDDFVSSDNTGFPANDDVTTSEIKFKPIVPYFLEPYGDLRRGPNHLFSDFVPGIDNASYYMFYNNTVGSEALLFRMRLGTVMPGAKGYSVLFDTDGKFGAAGPNADPNYIPSTTGTGGNPGFEVEIVLATGGGTDGILVYNVDGTDNPTSPITFAGWTNYSQIAIAATNDNGDPDFYIDYYVPKSALDAVGITTATSFRVVPTTVMAPKAAIGGPKSDIYGLADNNYKDPNDQYEDFIDVQPPIKLSDLGGGGTGSPTANICTAPPIINSPVNVGASITITGSWTKSSITGVAGSAIVYLYKNGATTPIAQTASPVSSGAVWSIPNITVANGDVFTAKAQAVGESICLLSNAVKAQNCNTGNIPSSSGLVISCNTNRGLEGSFVAGREVKVYFINPTTLVSSLLAGPLANSPTFGYSGANWFYNGTNFNGSQIPSACSGGAPDMSDGSYYVTTNVVGGTCESAPVYACLGLGVTATPTVTQNALYGSSKIISGTATAGAQVQLRINGQLAGTVTATGTNYSFSGLTLSVGDVVEIRAIALNSCMSNAVTLNVGCYTAPPTINTERNGQLKEAVAISGISGEPAGSVIRVYNSAGILLSTTTVQANGTWSTANAGTTNTNGFSGVAVGGVSYYANAQTGSCGISSNTSAISTPTGATVAARCGQITTTVPASGSPVTITSSTTSVSGTLSGTAVAGTIVSLYQDGFLVANYTTAGNTWGPVDVTNKFYNSGVITLGIQEPSKAEVICATTYNVSCSAPSTPVVNFLSCTSCGSTPNPANITPGGTITYRVSNLQGNTFYSIREQISGKSLAAGLWTDAIAPAFVDITTVPLTGGGTFTAEIVGTFVSSTGVCSAKATENYKVLPVTITELKGKTLSSANELTWKTVNEINFKQFEVERSIDGNRFEKIGQVTATGSGIYSFTDYNLVSISNYYRLKLVNNNGSFAYSHVVLLNQDNSIVIGTAKPNPFVNDFELQLTLAKNETMQLLLFDAKGKQVARKQLTATTGANVIRFSGLQHLAPGIYLLQVVTGDKILQQKMLRL